ncbi:hypothetical protein F2Q69_00006982 [Brassica cretica]|uniref:Replication protein A 70 kDa DNA-binding subunit B/D first OB fold domain-containing protein n=1 Tax=Brassica cretica TaxID=69181 RepID=A0A8S9P7P5_BRACR|nr:hypothetical protein F2Q69_00006982 [Brassica cretica]
MLVFVKGVGAVCVYNQPGDEATLVKQMVSDWSKLALPEYHIDLISESSRVALLEPSRSIRRFLRFLQNSWQREYVRGQGLRDVWASNATLIVRAGVQRRLDWRYYWCGRVVEKCKVVATIYAIDTDYAWYYFGCDVYQHMTFNVLEPDINRPIISKPLSWCEHCKKNAWDFYPRSGFDPRFDPDPIRKSGYPEGPNPDPDSKMLDPSKPDPDPDILIFKSGYPDPPWKTTWFIEAKVIHTWKPSNTGFGETLEIILADKNGIKVHATCRKNYLKSLGDQCIVGEWKSIENFQVSEPGKHFRPTKLMYKIKFDSVLSGRLETEFLIDIVGQAIDVGELQILQSNGKELRKIEFTLRNISYKLNDDSMSIVETNDEGKQIVPEANTETPQKVDTWKEYEDKTISEILGCTQVEKCKVVAIIYAIDTDYALYYFGCDVYQHMTFKVLEPDSNRPIISKPLFWCENCKKNVINVSPK